MSNYNAKDLILIDAIETAIDNERKARRYRIGCIILGITSALLLFIR